MTFEEKVKAMTAKEIILAMVEGLKAEHVTVEMGTFGHVEDRVCYGCAATNTICEINDRTPFPRDFIQGGFNRAAFLGASRDFVAVFEEAIDWLRCGAVLNYNSKALSLGIATIENPQNIKLPHLRNDSYRSNLTPFIQLAADQEGVAQR